MDNGMQYPDLTQKAVAAKQNNNGDITLDIYQCVLCVMVKWYKGGTVRQDKQIVFFKMWLWTYFACQERVCLNEVLYKQKLINQANKTPF